MATIDSHQGNDASSGLYYAVAQNFLVPDGHYTVESVTLRLWADSRGDTRTATVDIYSVDEDGAPDSFIARMGTVSNGDILEYPEDGDPLSAAFDVSFSGATSLLEPNTEYAIVLTQNTGPSAFITIYWAGTSAAHIHSWVKNDSFIQDWVASGSAKSFLAAGTYTAVLPAKAVNPDPADDAVGVDAALDVVMWENEIDVTSVDVYFGEAGSMALLEAIWTEGTYYVISGLEAGHEYEWRIDTTNRDGTTTGDVWSFTVASSYAVTPIAPVNEATGEKIIANGLSWDSVDVGVVFDVLFREFGTTEFTVIAESITDLLFAFPYNLTYNQIYFWTINEYTVDPGTGERTLVSTTGEQFFTTEALIEYPIPSRRTVPDGLTPPGTMSVITGDNCLAGIRRIVAACNNEIWYEAIE